MTVDLDALEALAAKATPGPWRDVAGDDVQTPDGLWRAVESDRDDVYYDARFIAAARGALPRLVAEVRALRARADVARAETLIAVERELQRVCDGTLRAAEGEALDGASVGARGLWRRAEGVKDALLAVRAMREALAKGGAS